jgi:light-regulated signal transduction histidine kinase (bacteriophytochrome)
MYSGLFIFNSISAAVMCAIFAYMGIQFEVKYRAELIASKNKAELHEQKIQKQNKHLHEIAFMNAHIVRSPLANILAITNLIESTEQSECDKEELMQLLKASAQQLDDNIKQMVAKATDKTM